MMFLFLLPWSHVFFFWRKIIQFTGSPNDADANSFWGSGSQKRQDTSEKTTEQWRKMLLLWISSVGIIPFGYRVIFNSFWTAEHGNPVLNWPGCEGMCFFSWFFVLFTTQWWSFLQSWTAFTSFFGEITTPLISWNIRTVCTLLKSGTLLKTNMTLETPHQ